MLHVMLQAGIVSLIGSTLCTGNVCPEGEFSVAVSAGETRCQQCTKCSQGKGVVNECTDVTDTVCEDCIPGETFSSVSSDIDKCELCVHCSPHQNVMQNCTVTRNARCAQCEKGYFYEDLTDTCEQCSYCFEGFVFYQSACDVPEVPEDHRCMPIRNTPYPPPHQHPMPHHEALVGLGHFDQISSTDSVMVNLPQSKMTTTPGLASLKEVSASVIQASDHNRIFSRTGLWLVTGIPAVVIISVIVLVYKCRRGQLCGKSHDHDLQSQPMVATVRGLMVVDGCCQQLIPMEELGPTCTSSREVCFAGDDSKSDNDVEKCCNGEPGIRLVEDDSHDTSRGCDEEFRENRVLLATDVPV